MPETKELSEEQQIEAMLKQKSGTTPVAAEPGNEDAAKKLPTKEDADDEPADEEKPLTAEEIENRLKEVEAKDEKDLTEEDKKFLEEHTEEVKEEVLSEKDIKDKIAEIEAKAEKDRSKEDKEFLEKYTEEEDEDDSITPDKFIEDEFGEKFSVKSVKDLNELLETAMEVTKERDDLKAQLEAKDKGPIYKSKSQQKVAEFLEKTGYDPAKFPEGLQTYSQLMSIDLEDKDIDPKLALEAKFIFDHPELTRAEAQKKFGKTYTKKYELKRDDFDGSDEEFKEAQEDVRIEQKSDVAKAIKALKKAQEEYKSEPEKKEDKKEVEVDPVLTKSIEQITKSLDEHLDQNDQLIFSPTEDKEDDFPFQFTKEQLGGIRAVCQSIINNPNSYDKKGKLVLGSVEELTQRAADFLYGNEIRDKLFEHALTITAAKRLEDLAETKPNRKARTTTASEVDLSEEKQVEIMIKKKKEGRMAVSA